jgi:hypothetical protein
MWTPVGPTAEDDPVTTQALIVPRDHRAYVLGDSAVERLGRRGWTLDDLAALVGDWPTTGHIALTMLCDAASDAAFHGATPEQARAWLHVLYSTSPTVKGGIVSSAALHSWVARAYRDVHPRPDVVNHWDVLDAYAEATDRDHDLALAAFAAGLAAEETKQVLASGEFGRATISGLAALRTAPR